jgi:hypothetical protein
MILSDDLQIGSGPFREHQTTKGMLNDTVA